MICRPQLPLSCSVAEDLDLPSAVSHSSKVIDDQTNIISLRDAREGAERTAITTALRVLSGNLTAAAKALGVSRPTLYNLMKQHDLTSNIDEGTGI